MQSQTKRYAKFNRSPSNKNGRFMAIIDFIMKVLTIIVSLSLLCAYLAPYVTPHKVWFIAFAGLVIPVLFIITFALILYWGIRWNRFILIPASVFILGGSNLTLFFRPTFSKEISEEQKNETVVVSYNVMGFRYEPENSPHEESLEQIADFVKEQDASVFCIQEYESISPERKLEIDSIIGMPYSAVIYKIEYKKYGGGWGIAIYSKFPIIDSGEIEYTSSTNSSMWADLVIGNDTIRVFNNHLQTTSVNQKERDYLSNHEYIQDDRQTREEKVMGIASKLKRNFLIRADQADILAPLIRNSPYKVIVCGDFNDTPMSYVYSTIRGDLSDAFANKGQGMISNTYKGLFNMFRIDYVFHSREIETLNYSSPPIKYSDHKPVVVGLKLPGELR